MKKQTLTLLTAGFLCSCNFQPEPAALVKGTSVDLRAARAHVERTNRKIEDAFMKGDSSSIIALYHKDAVIYAPNQPAGNAASLGALIKQIPLNGITKFSLSTTELMEAGEYLIESGDYVCGDDEQLFESGNFMVIWKMEEGSWKPYRDMWNMDTNPIAVLDNN